MSPVFSHGDLRLYLLNLLDEEPRIGVLELSRRLAVARCLATGRTVARDRSGQHLGSTGGGRKCSGGESQCEQAIADAHGCLRSLRQRITQSCMLIQ